ncbi:MAG: AmmeMemoRadiSam system radical SAM enzyme [Candidatus Omnitrophota bacterium]
MSTKIQCHLCTKHCLLDNGQRGDCRARMNIDGKLYSLVYGNPCAVHVDPIEKKPLFHVKPATSAFSIATAGCNGHCKFCQNWQISQRPPEETHNFDLPPEAVVAAAIRNKCQSIAYTYSDPVIFYEYMFDTAGLAHQRGILNLMITAGLIEKEPLLDLCPLIDAANVDLKSIKANFYRDICSLDLSVVQNTIVTMQQQGVWVELTNLIIPTLNDTQEEIRELCRWVKDHVGCDMPLHFSRFWPMHQLRNLPPTPIDTLTKSYEIARSEGLHFVYVGNVPGHEGNNTYCPNDGKLLVKRVGYMIQENHIINGKCEFCQSEIPGIW